MTYTQNLLCNKDLFSEDKDFTRVISHLEKEQFSDSSPQSLPVSPRCVRAEATWRGGGGDERANEETSVKAAAQGHRPTERQTSSQDYRLLVSPHPTATATGLQDDRGLQLKELRDADTSEEEYREKPKVKRGDKTQDAGRSEASGTDSYRRHGTQPSSQPGSHRT